jgi:hypothetical protein
MSIVGQDSTRPNENTILKHGGLKNLCEILHLAARTDNNTTPHIRGTTNDRFCPDTCRCTNMRKVPDAGGWMYFCTFI